MPKYYRQTDSPASFLLFFGGNGEYYLLIAIAFRNCS